MAITPTNSNTVSIANLPTSQIAVGTDLLILQTTNGTRTITFDNFNAVKTDIAGNATVTGNLTGNSASFNSITVKSISASAITTPAGPAATLPTGFYNQFTIQNGLILSATLNVQGDPVYNQLSITDTPSIINGLLQNYGVTPVLEKYGVVLIPAGTTSYTVTLDNFFATKPGSYITIGNITPAHFNLTTDFVPTLGTLADYTTNNPSISAVFQSLTAFPWPVSVTPLISPRSISVASSSDGSSTALSFTITIGNAQSVDVSVYWRFNIVLPLNVTS